jgi:NTP pyrophosphatase (non-canonical NTP hydrolase)
VACFQWLTPDDSIHIMDNPGAAEAVQSEVADVLQYLTRLADVLGVDRADAVRQKAQRNETRFPPKTR